MYIHPNQLERLGFPETEVSTLRGMFPNGTPLTVEAIRDLLARGFDMVLFGKIFFAKHVFDPMAKAFVSFMDTVPSSDKLDEMSESIYMATVSTMSYGFYSGLPVYFAYNDPPVSKSEQYEVGGIARVETPDGHIVAVWVVEFSTPEYAGGRIVATTGYNAPKTNETEAGA